MEEYFRIVGQINYSLARITFVVSQYFHEFGIESSRGSFFSRYKTEKFKSLHKELTKISKDRELILKVKDWSDRLLELIKSRNDLTHSLVLSSIDNKEEFHLYNYKNVGKKIEQKVVEINVNELRDLNHAFIDLYNEGFVLFSQVEKSLPSVSIFSSNNLLDRWEELELKLKFDSENDDSGFYKYLDFIKQKFFKYKVIVALSDGDIIGYATYAISGGIVNIDFFQIFFGKRMAGFGRMFARKLIQHFKEQNCIAISCRADERRSSKFWFNVGFKKVDDSIKGISISHYLPLVDSLENKAQGNAKIEIWDPLCPSSLKANKKRVWRFNTNDNSLSTCVLAPVNLDWRLKLTVNKEVRVNEVIKYIKMGSEEITIGYFLYIQNIKKFAGWEF